MKGSGLGEIVVPERYGVEHHESNLVQRTATDHPQPPPVNSVFQALGARFCHDLASPIGALRLMLEAHKTNFIPADDLALLQQNQASLTYLLEFYRIFFTTKPSQRLFIRTVDVLGKACSLKKAQSSWPDEMEEESDALGKAIALVAFPFLGALREGDNVSLHGRKGRWQLTFCTQRPLPYYDLVAALENSDTPTQREQWTAHYALLKECLKDHTLQLIVESSEEKYGKVTLICTLYSSL